MDIIYDKKDATYGGGSDICLTELFLVAMKSDQLAKISRNNRDNEY